MRWEGAHEDAPPPPTATPPPRPGVYRAAPATDHKAISRQSRPAQDPRFARGAAAGEGGLAGGGGGGHGSWGTAVSVGVNGRRTSSPMVEGKERLGNKCVFLAAISFLPPRYALPLTRCSLHRMYNILVLNQLEYTYMIICCSICRYFSPPFLIHLNTSILFIVCFSSGFSASRPSFFFFSFFLLLFSPCFPLFFSFYFSPLIFSSVFSSFPPYFPMFFLFSPLFSPGFSSLPFFFLLFFISSFFSSFSSFLLCICFFLPSSLSPPS